MQRSGRVARTNGPGRRPAGAPLAAGTVALAAGALCVLGPGAAARADSAPPPSSTSSTPSTPATGTAAATASPTGTASATASPTTSASPTGTSGAATDPPGSGGGFTADYAATPFVIKGAVGQSWIEVHVPEPTVKIIQGTTYYDRTTWRVVMPPGVTALVADDQGEAAICTALAGGRAADCGFGPAPFGTVLWVRIDRKVPGATGTVTVRPSPAVDPNPANDTAPVTTDITDAPGATAGTSGGGAGGAGTGGAGTGGASSAGASGGTGSGGTGSGGTTGGGDASASGNVSGSAGGATTAPAGPGALAATGAGGVPVAVGTAALALAAGTVATAAARRRRRGSRGAPTA